MGVDRAAKVTRARFIRLAIFVLALAPAVDLAIAFSSGALATPYRTILHQTGLWSMRLLTLGLLISPLTRLTGWVWPSLLRRMLGLLAASYAFAHTWAFCRQYGYFWSLILPEFTRLYMALGLAAVMLLVPLTLTSNARARQALGAAWAKLHQLAYPIALLALIHFMLFRAIAPRESWIHAALITVALVTRFVPRRTSRAKRDRAGGTSAV